MGEGSVPIADFAQIIAYSLYSV